MKNLKRLAKCHIGEVIFLSKAKDPCDVQLINYVFPVSMSKSMHFLLKTLQHLKQQYKMISFNLCRIG